MTQAQPFPSPAPFTPLSAAQKADITHQALHGMEDGELFLEHSLAESLVFDDGKLKTASLTTEQGFGLRAVVGERTGFAHGNDLSAPALYKAVQSVRAVRNGYEGIAAPSPAPLPRQRALYGSDNPVDGIPFTAKVVFLQQVDAYLRSKDPRVRQVTISLASSYQCIEICKPDGFSAQDIRPLVRIDISVVVEENGRMERGSMGQGSRGALTPYITPDIWQKQADEALRQALVNLAALPAPAGEMEVVLGPGWPGILLHEAIGHGLEGDFNRKKTSAFAGLLGQRVAAKGVTVVDDGTIENRRGSLTIDDEGTATECTTLIEDGILVGYMQDRLNARLMGMNPTGNGRRESYCHAPLPRMTNTYMLGRNASPEEMIRSVKRGLYAVNFGGGQVDITSGKFVFSASEAYRIEDGRITSPVKGATLIGNGPDVLTKVAAVGNDMRLDSGIGTCGKAGQGVPVGVGQPSLLIRGITVGGTEI